MILTPEEQLEYREEIDYAIETHGYEYIWGNETTIDKLRGLSRDAPGKIIDAVNRFVTNPTVININEKLKAHAEKINAQEAEQRMEQRNDTAHTKPRRNQMHKQKPRSEESAWQKGFVLDGDDHL